MNARAAAGLAACAVALLSSCVSTPRSAPPLTIEMFDSRAAVLRTTVFPQFTLLLPAVPVDASALTPVTEEGPGAAPKAAPFVSSNLPLPAAPASGPAGVDASLAGPSRPVLRASFALAAPAVPPAAASAVSGAPIVRRPPAPSAAAPRAKTAPSANASIPELPRTAAAAPVTAAAPSPSAGATAAPANPAGTGAASAAGAVSAPGGSAPSSAAASAASSASPGAYGRLREIYARQGDTLQVGLDGVGFLFLGLPDAQSDGMSFKSKENRDNRTLFTFQALKLGTYDLDFLRQDNRAGTTSRETVRVHVVSDQDFNTAVTAAPGGMAPDPTDAAGDPQFAQKLATMGSYQAAVAELLKGYRDGNPGLNDQIANLYMRMGSYDAAGKYYAKNLQPPSDYTPRAVVGLMSVAVAQDDQQALLSLLKQFLRVTDPGAEQPLIQAVRMEKAHSEIGVALDLAQQYVTRYPSGTWRDEADFLTAQLLEADSPFRDIARARELYSAILSGHPESPFAETARGRVQYIDRHFYQVR